MVQIVITPAAQSDLADIFNHIAKDSYKNAEVVTEAIIKKVDVLYKHVHSGQIVKEFNNPSIRELKLFKYRIIYRISDNVIEIITIHHSSRLLNNNPNIQDLFE